jgi:hypothetical protein
VFCSYGSVPSLNATKSFLLFVKAASVGRFGCQFKQRARCQLAQLYGPAVRCKSGKRPIVNSEFKVMPRYGKSKRRSENSSRTSKLPSLTCQGLSV